MSDLIFSSVTTGRKNYLQKNLPLPSFCKTHPLPFPLLNCVDHPKMTALALAADVVPSCRLHAWNDIIWNLYVFLRYTMREENLATNRPLTCTVLLIQPKKQLTRKLSWPPCGRTFMWSACILMATAALNWCADGDPFSRVVGMGVGFLAASSVTQWEKKTSSLCDRKLRICDSRRFPYTRMRSCMWTLGEAW